MNSSDSSEEGGNTNSPSTKQVIPSIRWIMVLNNYTIEEINIISSVVRQYCKYAIIEEEIGESGTPHLQGYFELKTKARPSSLFKLPRIHFEKAKGTREQNDVYCSKDNKIIVSIGRPKPIKIITNLYDWQINIINIMQTEPDDRTIYWYYEPIGSVGKSQFVKYCAVKHNVLMCNGGKMGDIMNLVFNQNMDETTCVMFDIPRPHEGHVSYASLECIKNGMVCNTKYETGVKIFNSPHIFCFANFPPDDTEKLSRDRWHIFNLRTMEREEPDDY